MSYIKELRNLVGHRPLILVGEVVIVMDERDRILMHHRTDEDAWDLPGGFMELNEAIEETARREVKEETRLSVEELKLVEIFSGEEFFYTCPNGDQVCPVTVVYQTRNFSGTLQADGEEGCEVLFCALDDLPVGTYPECRRIIQECVVI